MSLNSELRTALIVIFILTTAGSVSVAAQNQVVAGKSSTQTATNAASTSEPKKAEDKKPSAAISENTLPAELPVPPTPAPAATDKWQFQFSPYGWLASLHGTAGVGTRTTQVDERFSDIFHVLNFVLMGTFEARKGKLISLTDLEYVSIEDDKATPGPLFSSLNAKFKIFILDPEVGYRVFENPDTGSSVDVLGGVRVWHVSTHLTFSPGILAGTEAQGSRTWVDGVFGLSGKAALSKKVFATGKFDLGGGGSNFTYQVFGGVGYSIKPNIALIGGYRVLDVDYNKNSFIYDMNQRGPILGLGFRF
jgi:hypothetical protein